MLKKGDFQLLVDRFGYVMTGGSSPIVAVENGFRSCVAEFRSSPEQQSSVSPSIVVKYFTPNTSGLYALVECVFTAAEGCPILAELVVYSLGEDKHIHLEQVSVATASTERFDPGGMPIEAKRPSAWRRFCGRLRGIFSRR